MKHSHFALFVLSSVIFTHVAIADEPPLSPVPAATPTSTAQLPAPAASAPLKKEIKARLVVDFGVGVGASGDATKSGSYQAQIDSKKPETRDTETGKEDGQIKTVAFQFSIQGGRTTSNDSPATAKSDVGGSFVMEHASGEYQKTASKETATTRIWQVEVSKDAMVGEAAGKFRFGGQISGGSEQAPVGHLTLLPIQRGLSARYGAYIEAGVGQQDGESGPSARVNLKLEEQLQYCASLDHAEKNALCLSFRANQILGSQAGGNLGGDIKYAHKIADGANKSFVFVGIDGSAAGLQSVDKSVSNGGAQAGLVAGVATQ